MKFTVYGENVKISKEMNQSIEERLGKIGKYIIIDDQLTAKVTVKKYNNSLKVEINVPSKIGLLRSEVVHDDFFTAIDLACDKLEDQIRRQKGRLSRRHKEALSTAFLETSSNELDVPVKTKTIFADEMTLDDAIVSMELSSHAFYVYKDLDSQKIAVVYKRNNGGYGLIEVME